MPIYFFHITESGECIHDLEGIECPDLTSVQAEAVEGAIALMGEAVRKGQRNYRGRFDVEDERGETIFMLTFACPVETEAMPPLVSGGLGSINDFGVSAT